MGLVLGNMGATARNRGDSPRAAVLYEQALPHVRKSSDLQMLGLLLFNMGELGIRRMKRMVARFEKSVGHSKNWVNKHPIRLDSTHEWGYCPGQERIHTLLRSFMKDCAYAVKSATRTC
jgi:hypothetical protein